MARCRSCAWFPWKPGADLSYLPAVKCHENLPVRRWTEESASLEHDCQCFKSRGGPQPKSTEAPVDPPKAPIEGAANATKTGAPAAPQKGQSRGGSGSRTGDKANGKPAGRANQPRKRKVKADDTNSGTAGPPS